VRIRITDNDGNPLPTGEPGQVWVHTPAVMLGYWKREDATEKALVDGWLRMGDTGYLDENGYLFLQDRVDDTIIVAGQNIYPTEIEKALAEHPAVADVAVIGIPHERWGEAVQACVVLREDQTVRPRDLMLSLRGRLADYKIPTRYEFVEDIPRNPTGKIVRRHLREKFGAPA
jgi:fatty-acyl-CoA synthase